MDTENVPLINNDSTEEQYKQLHSARNSQHVSFTSGDDYALKKDFVVSNPGTHVYKRRWYILFLFCLFAMLQSYLSNVWTVIAVSVNAAFGWSYQEISLMQNWYPVLFLITVFPVIWLLDAKGIRISIVLSASFLVVGCILRCISMQDPYVTWLNNIAHIVIATFQPIVYIIPPAISNTWFPANERTTATSISTVIIALGLSLCFLIGPLVVDNPVEVDNGDCITSSDPSTNCYTNLNEIRNEITNIRACETVVSGIILIMILIYFPNKPPKPPTVTAALPKYSFRDGFKHLFKRSNANFWLLGVAYCLSGGGYTQWLGLLTVVFKDSLSQKTIGYLGSLANVTIVVAAVIYGRFGDKFLGKLKLIVFTSMCCSVIVTFWVLLLAMKYIPMSKSAVEIFIAIFLQSVLVAGPIGIFVELGVEQNYPISESITNAVFQFLWNIFSIIYLSVFFIPNIGTSWMTWATYVSLCASVFLLFFFKERYPRLEIDKHEMQT